jgi:hypothetical protein
VPPHAPLHASLGLPENDVLVLAYLLDRPLRRARLSCDRSDAGSCDLRRVRSRATATSPDRLVAFGGLELVRCASF